MESTALKSKLQQAGYKATSPRLNLLRILENAEEPLSIQKILERFKEKKVDQATIYRGLRTLARAGIVRQIDLKHAHAHFELNSDDHHHLVCVECGKIEDVEECSIDARSEKILKNSKSFKIISRHSLEFFGVCKKCATK